MSVADAAELKVRAVPALVAKLPVARLRRAVPLSLHAIVDPLATHEPTVEVPQGADVAAVLHNFLEEVQLTPSEIVWQPPIEVHGHRAVR